MRFWLGLAGVLVVFSFCVGGVGVVSRPGANSAGISMRAFRCIFSLLSQIKVMAVNWQSTADLGNLQLD